MEKIEVKIDCGGFFMGLAIGILLGMIAAAKILLQQNKKRAQHNDTTRKQIHGKSEIEIVRGAGADGSIHKSIER